MLKQRLILGALMTVALVVLIWCDDRLARDANRQSGDVVFAVLILLVGFAGYELRSLFKAGGYPAGDLWTAVICLGVLCIPKAVVLDESSQSPQATADYKLTLLLLAVGLIGSFVSLLRHKKAEGAIGSLSASVFIILYMGLLPSFILRIAVWTPTGGAWLLLYFIGTVKICDIGAYFSGRFLGRRKLIEWLSPGKTVEGMAGGIAASLVVALAVPALVRLLGPATLADMFPGWQTAALFGFLMAIFGQAGDLMASIIKREAGAKDSARAVPGFGGVLDILDSLLLTAPIAFWLLVK